MKFKIVALPLLSLFLAVAPAFAECGVGSIPMQVGEVYSFKKVEIDGKILKGWYTTSKLKKGELRQPYYRDGKFTIIHRYCHKPIVARKITPDYTSVICPK